MRTHPERFTQEPHGAGRERSEERGREHGRLGESALLVMRSTSVITAKPRVRQPHTGRGARNISVVKRAGPALSTREAPAEKKRSTNAVPPLPSWDDVHVGRPDGPMSDI